MSLHRSGPYIGGQERARDGGPVLSVVSPSTEEEIGTAPSSTPDEIDDAVSIARETFESGIWRNQPLEARIATVRRAASLLEERISELAELITREMGVPISANAKAFVPGAIGVMRELADLADSVWTEQRRGAESLQALVRRGPVGVVAGIGPWNGPLSTAVTKIVTPLLMGCSVVYKPAPETPLDVYILAEALTAAGLPPGVIGIVPGGADTGRHLVAHPGVDKVSFTGSTTAGRWVATTCAQRLARVSLELGGKSAAIVLDDADLEQLAGVMRGAAFGNSGQVCAALSRLLVHRSIYDQTVEAVVATAARIRVGDPLDPKTHMGPVISSTARDRIEASIKQAIGSGATVALAGGRPADLPVGWFLKPTVLSDVQNSDPIAQEELFGPVLTVTPYDNEAEAIRIANDSAYGLHGAVFTTDPQRALRIADAVETGTFTVNGYVLNTSAPFGGVKASGIGREFGLEGFEEVLELKTINVPAGLPDSASAVVSKESA